MTGPVGFAAELYRLTHRGNPGDVAFYSALCEPAQSVLELGSGYGRLVTALARAGRQLVGLELDRGLLGLARQSVSVLPTSKRRNLRLVRGDMRRFELGQTFERVLLPYNGLYCLLNRREAEGCLRSVRRVLAPGGVFALDVWNADEFHAQLQSAFESNERRPDGDDMAEPLFGFVHDQRRFRVFETSRFHKTKQRLDVRYDYVPDGRGKLHSMTLQQRYFLPDELTQLLQREGFRVTRRYGSFNRSRFTARSRELILLATLA